METLHDRAPYDGPKFQISTVPICFDHVYWFDQALVGQMGQVARC